MKNFGLLLLVTLILAPTSAAQTGPESHQDPGSTTTPGSLSRGQQMVNRFVANHPELAALEIALMSRDGGCSTVAASSPEDVGEACDADELGPIRTGQPEVEAPSREDPVYDITQALHDAQGHLVGAVGMDLKPEIGTRDEVMARAAALLRELEAQIPSKSWLLEAAGR